MVWLGVGAKSWRAYNEVLGQSPCLGVRRAKPPEAEHIFIANTYFFNKWLSFVMKFSVYPVFPTYS